MTKSIKCFKIICVISLLFYILAGCDDMFQKKIDVNITGAEPKLAITAILDTDSGRFSIYIFNAYPMASLLVSDIYGDEIVRNGEIRLFEGEQLLYAIQGPFDLSTKYTFPDTRNGYRFTAKELPLKAGKTYQLEVDIDGYPKAISSSKMPDVSGVVDAILDTTKFLYAKNNITLRSLGNDYAYPVYISLNDRSYSSDDFFYFELQTYAKFLEKKNGGRINQCIGVSEYNFILDNPVYLTEKGEFDKELYDLYWLDGIMLSDAMLCSVRPHFNLYVAANVFTSGFPFCQQQIQELQMRYGGSPEEWWPYSSEGPVLFEHDLVIKHVSKDVYKHYKTMTLQRPDDHELSISGAFEFISGINYFTEPINVSGNIRNAFGCFVLSNTQRIRLLDYVTPYHNLQNSPD